MGYVEPLVNFFKGKLLDENDFSGWTVACLSRQSEYSGHCGLTGPNDNFCDINNILSPTLPRGGRHFPQTKLSKGKKMKKWRSLSPLSVFVTVLCVAPIQFTVAAEGISWFFDGDNWCLSRDSRRTCVAHDLVPREMGPQMAAFYTPSENHASTELLHFFDAALFQSLEPYPDARFKEVDRRESAAVVRSEYTYQETGHPDLFLTVLRFSNGDVITIDGRNSVEVFSLGRALSEYPSDSTE